MLFSDHNDIKSETNKNFPQIFRNKHSKYLQRKIRSNLLIISINGINFLLSIILGGWHYL